MMVIVYYSDKPVGAAPQKQCFTIAGGSTIFCIVWYISLYLDRLLVVLIKGGNAPWEVGYYGCRIQWNTRVVLEAAQHKTLHSMNDASLNLRK